MKFKSKNILTNIGISLTFLLIASCAVAPQSYENQTPTMDMKTYFNGPIQAWGLFQDYRGQVTRRFHVDMIGKWKGNKGILEEDFIYSDGTKERRVWHLVQKDKHNYVGTADDVVGEAVGEAHGFALRWKYTLALKVDDGIYNVQFDDWMYLINERTMINRSVMSKFGVPLGEVILVFIKDFSTRDRQISSQDDIPFSTPEIGQISNITSAVL